MNFEQEFNANFGEKYNNLQLKEVVVKRKEKTCTITFLYPSTVKEMSDEEKKEVVDWIKSNLDFEEMSLKVKFMRVFVEEKLIMKSMQNYFEKKYKLITTYLTPEHFQIEITPIDVLVSIELSGKMIEYFAENKIPADLARYLKDNFLVEFVVNLIENENIVDEVDIENVEMKTKYKVVKRYNVEIIKEIVGKDIMTKPEYLSFITAPKTSVIVAGYIKKIERKDFIRKTGKNAGKPKAYYNFQIQDRKGKMDCIYFSTKSNERNMDALEECMFVLLHGDVRLNQIGKLCLYVDKMALASEVEQEEEQMKKNKFKNNGEPVVEIEKLTSLEQDTMFEEGNKYNDKIMNKTIVVFDIETTGLDSSVDEIIEIGAVKVVNGQISEKFSSFVHPTKKIPYEVMDLTGITNEMVEDAPPAELVLKEFYDFTRDCVLSGHNVINFDIKFVKREGGDIGLTFDNPLIDTMREAMASKLKISRFNLGTVVKALGLTLEGAHRAWNDAYATAQVLLKLNEVE